MSAGNGSRSRDRSRERRQPSSSRSTRRVDERNSTPQRSSSDFFDMVPPSSLARRANEMSGGRGLAPPPKFSGTPFSEAELLNEVPKKKFTQRCRLFVGNLPIDLKESELKELFSPHGDISECYLSGKGFAFLRLDTRAHAESAKEALDGKNIKGRQIRVRFAVHGASIRLKELSPVVSNEMLHLTFSVFGEVERAVHIVDEKGKPTGEGIVEFERKTSAVEAISQMKERVFLMTANSRPLIADFVEPRDEEDGLSEKMIQKTHQLMKERELGPRFAAMNSFEYVYGKRWKELYEYEQKRRQELEGELREQRRRLDADMEVAYEDYKAELLREELQRRQEELERLDAARRMRDQQRQQMIEANMDRWAPPIGDGPMRVPGGGLFASGPPPGMGGIPPPPEGRGMQNGNQQPLGPPRIPPNLQKLLEPFKQPMSGDQQQNEPGGVPPPLGRMPPPAPMGMGGGGSSGGLLGNPARLSPLSAFAGLINPLMNRPPGPGVGRGASPGPSGMPPPLGLLGGGRIPPPPPPLGSIPPPPRMMMMRDFPPEKRPRH